MPISLPTHTVTFLLRILNDRPNVQEYPDRWEDLRAKHHAILQTALETHDAHVFQIIKDAFCVGFKTASDRLNAQIDTQPALNRIKKIGIPGATIERLLPK